MANSLYSLKFISSSAADNAKFQYSQLLKTEVVNEREKFVAFDFRTLQRLDSFLYPIVGTKPQYAELWRICQLVCILNHGQAFTERGFSINKKVSDVNTEDDSLIAQRLVYDGLKNSGVEVWDFPITKNLRKSCKQSAKRMHLDKEKRKDNEQKTDKELKRNAKHEEIENLKKRKVGVETLKTSLTKEAIVSGTCGNKV